MKKSIIALFAAAMSAGVSAQDSEGGAGSTGLGAVTAPVVATAAVVAGVVAGIASNNSSTTPVETVTSCEGTDPLVDGVCVGTTECSSDIYLRTDRTVIINSFEKAAFISGFFIYAKKVFLLLNNSCRNFQ